MKREFGQPPADRARDVVLLALLLAPGYLNDFFLIAATSRKEVLLIDYISKALPLLMLAFMPSLQPVVRAAVTARPDWRWTAVFVPVCVLALPAIYILEGILFRVLPNTQMFAFGVFAGPEWYLWDITFGLTLSCVTEELVGRAVLAAVLLRRGYGVGTMIVVSTLIFAGAHWSTGLASIASSFLFGILFMSMYLKTRSIWPGVVAHFASNAVILA